MTLPRGKIVSDEISQWYHVVNRCVRRAYLCGEGFEHRKEMVRQRLLHVSKTFCIEIASYAIMDNHLHIVMRLDPKGATAFSDREVATRWLQSSPAQWDWNDDNAIPEIDEEKLNAALESPELIEKWRARLCNMGECLRAIKEPISRRCNKEDACTGAFWEGRYKSIPLLDQAALIACMAYVDLNPIRACMAETPEQSDYTAVQDRIDLRQLFEKEHSLRQRLRANASNSSIVNSLHIKPQKMHTSESHIWLTPIKACITGDWGQRDNGLKPDDYLNLIEATGRIMRGDKRGSINKQLAPILKRLNLDVKSWVDCMSSQQQMIGSAIGHFKSRIDEATRRGISWVRNRCSLFTDTA